MGTFGFALCVLFVAFLSLRFSPSIALTVGEPKEYRCSNGSAKTTELCLKNALLKDYDTAVRPVPHHSNQTTVYLAFFPIRIRVYEAADTVRMICWIEKSWVDELLTWDPSEFHNLQKLSLKPSLIWQPDIHPLPLKGAESGWTSTSTASILPNGTVNAAATVNYYSYCERDASRWPYDKYKCNITLQSEMYKGSELNILLMDHKTPELKYFLPEAGWTLISMSSARISSNTFDSRYSVVNLDFKFVIERRASKLATTAIFPVVVSSMAQLAFFFLDKESSTRLVLCGMVAATQCLYFSFISKELPPTGEMPYLVHYYKFALLLTVFVMVWTILARYIASLQTFPYCLHIATLKIHKNRFLSPLMPGSENLGNSTIEDGSNLIAPTEAKKSQWQNMAQFLDRVLLILCLLIYLFLYFIYVP